MISVSIDFDLGFDGTRVVLDGSPSGAKVRPNVELEVVPRKTGALFVHEFTPAKLDVHLLSDFDDIFERKKISLFQNTVCP